MENSKLNKLPLKEDFETVGILKALSKASRALAELKGEMKTIPNESILINTLGLQEAKDSSAIENIITTQSDLYRVSVDDTFKNSAAKEVQNYVEALKQGFELVRKHNLLTANNIKTIHSRLEANKPDFRKITGTVLKKSKGEVIYTPPQGYDVLLDLMSNLEKYINDNDLQDIDPLIKMPIIHFQFESIHPFYDGNGRTGRIINILYLVQQKLLDIPVLYLSRYIIQNKGEYYRHLQDVREKNTWEEWVIWMLNGVEITAKETSLIIAGIRELMLDYKHRIRDKYKFYSQDLVNNLFKHPYTKIEFIENDLKVSRPTATNYLNSLAKDGFLEKIKIGRSNYYVNIPLFEFLQNFNSQNK